MWIFRRDFLFFGHHFICLFGILAFFAIPAGVGCFVVGATVLELGNFTYNIVLLMGKDSSKDVPPRVKHFAETLYAVCMPLSNFVGATMFAWFLNSQSSRARRGSTAWAPPGSPSSREENTCISRAPCRTSENTRCVARREKSPTPTPRRR